MACRVRQMRFRAQMVGSVVDIPGESAVEGCPAHAERNKFATSLHFSCNGYIVTSMNDVQNH
jgi:hypothetical protein